MFHLEIQPARTTSQLQSAANPNELADEGYTVSDGYVIVETQAEADKLLSQYSNLELDLGRGSDDTEEVPRATVDTPNGDDGSEAGTCDVVKGDGDVCGRERPCPYHD